MAKLKIYTIPDKVLSQKAATIPEVTEKYRQLSQDMLETMYAAPGIGLAANQVGLLERMIVVDVDYDYEPLPEDLKDVPEDAEVIGDFYFLDRQPRVLINPEIVESEGEVVFCEGCLSVPEFTADVKRAEKIKLQYLDLDGKTQTLDADGLLAICIQHEIDHLDGKLFIDRLSPLKREMVRKRLIRERKQRDADLEVEFRPKDPNRVKNYTRGS